MGTSKVVNRDANRFWHWNYVLQHAAFSSRKLGLKHVMECCIQCSSWDTILYKICIIISRWNSKGSLLAFTTLSGICSTMCIMNWKGGIPIGLDLVSYFSACTAFIMLMICTLKLFPTCVRNTASSMVRQELVLGAVFSPVLISAGRSTKVLSYGVSGLVILYYRVFVFCLPEIRGVTLCLP